MNGGGRSSHYSGSGSGGSGGSGGSSGVDCSTLTVETTLASIQQAVAATLSVGDVLDVALDGSGQRPVVGVFSGGELVGSLLERVVDFVGCINQGTTYEAEVLSADDTVVRVRVCPA